MSRQKVPVGSRALFLPNFMIWGMLTLLDRPQLGLDPKNQGFSDFLHLDRGHSFPDSDMWLSLLNPASHPELALDLPLAQVSHSWALMKCGHRNVDMGTAAAVGRLPGLGEGLQTRL